MKVAALKIIPSPDFLKLRPLITCGILHAVACATRFGRVALVVIRDAFMGMRRVIRLVPAEFEKIGSLGACNEVRMVKVYDDQQSGCARCVDYPLGLLFDFKPLGRSPGFT